MTLVATLISEAANNIGDPSQQRIKPATWLMLYNDTLEEITRDYRILERDATFDISLEEDRYAYPDDLVQAREVRWSSTPTDVNSYAEVGERFDDEQRELTRYGKFDGDTDFHYWARAEFFQLDPKPTVTVTDGGFISYWRLATPITVVQGAVFELPATLRKLSRTLLESNGLEAMERYAEAASLREQWENKMLKAYEKFEDRSDDRRAKLRLKSATRRFRGMV